MGAKTFRGAWGVSDDHAVRAKPPSGSRARFEPCGSLDLPAARSFRSAVVCVDDGCGEGSCDRLGLGAVVEGADGRGRGLAPCRPASARLGGRHAAGSLCRRGPEGMSLPGRFVPGTLFLSSGSALLHVEAVAGAPGLQGVRMRLLPVRPERRRGGMRRRHPICRSARNSRDARRRRRAVRLRGKGSVRPRGA